MSNYIEGIDNELKSQVFTFLDDLREEGSINMFGAPREVQDTFGVNRNVAMDIFTAWTEELKHDGAEANFNGEC